MNRKNSSPPFGSLPARPGARPGRSSPRGTWALRFLASAALVIVAGLALVFMRPAGRQPHTVTLGEQQSGRQVTLAAGDKLDVSLAGNPSTGFSWNVQSFDATVLRQAGEPEFQPASSALGSGGTFTYRFEAIGAGQTTLALAYSRPFEKGVPAQKIFTARVVVARP